MFYEKIFTFNNNPDILRVNLLPTKFSLLSKQYGKGG